MRQRVAHPSLIRTQSGIAALEFALIAALMISMLMGLLVWWRYFQAHQAVTRAAGDGARIAHSLISTGANYPCTIPNANANRTVIQDRVSQVARLGLQRSSLPDEPLVMGSFEWTCPSSANSPPGSFSFKISYQLPPLLSNTFFINEPQRISEQSVVHFRYAP
ncbi:MULTISPECIES: TadE family protein [Delftia]|uniref:Pilus assembly protein n=2 Tax=Delftia TaxID=80865 RepID=A0A7T2S8M4_DELAC|nr:TadE family protein [Delftia acidovorans]MBL8354008.1 pilus assembly protein [Delftia acidovorans]QPS10823.1 pilus assembly protein [Delftia acidovorans]